VKKLNCCCLVRVASVLAPLVASVVLGGCYVVSPPVGYNGYSNQGGYAQPGYGGGYAAPPPYYAPAAPYYRPPPVFVPGFGPGGEVGTVYYGGPRGYAAPLYSR
jgi:hypothetical protein